MAALQKTKKPHTDTTPKKTKTKGTPLLGVRLSAEQRNWVKQQAEVTQHTESDVVRSLIEEAMHGAGTGSAKHSIVDIFADIAASVPAEVWEALPADLNDQLDHYVYGTPKR